MISPKLEANLRGHVLSLTLTNSTVHAIKVDRELVFLVAVTPVNSENRVVGLREVCALPSPDRESLMARFVWLQPGKSIERTIDLTKPFKTFTFGFSDQMAITAYEALQVLPQEEAVAEIHIIYGVQHGMKEALGLYIAKEEWYTGKQGWPKDLYQGPLKCTVSMKPKSGRENTPHKTTAKTQTGASTDFSSSGDETAQLSSGNDNGSTK